MYGSDISTFTFWLLERWDEFRKLGGHIVPVEGKSRLIEPLPIVIKLKIATFAIFDADGNTEDKDGRRAKQEKDNKALLRLVAANANGRFPQGTLWGGGFAVWPHNIAATVRDDIGADDWKKFTTAADAEHGNVGGLAKNTLHIGASLELAGQAGKSSPAWFCGEILNPASRVAC